MSNLSSFLGGTSGEVKLTATGTITAGDLVSLLSDGTAIKSTDPEFDTPTNIDGSNRAYLTACHIPNTQKYVVVYQGNSSYGTAGVVDYSTGSAVVGTPVVFNSATTTLNGCVYHAGQNVVVIGFFDTGGKVIAASISGTTLTFGSSAGSLGAWSQYPYLTYDSVNQAVVVGYTISTASYAVAVTASGTTLTVGSVVTVAAATNYISGAVFDATSGKIVFAYHPNSGASSFRIGTVSGTTITLGTVFTPPSSTYPDPISYPRLCYNPLSGKTYIFGRISYTSGEPEETGFVTTAVISGTTISLGKIQVLPNTQLYPFHAISSAGQEVIFSEKERAFYVAGSYSQAIFNQSYVFYKILVDDETYTVETSPFTPQVRRINNQGNFVADSDGSNLLVLGGRIGTTAAVFTRRSLAESTSLNWFGLAKESVTNGQTLSVVVPGGVATGLSSLTPGANYYTAGASYAKAGYEKIGKALSATSMLITG